MPIELYVYVPSSDAPCLNRVPKQRFSIHTISDERFQAFIKSPTADAVDAFITEITSEVKKEHSKVDDSTITANTVLFSTLIIKSLKKPQERQDYIVALVKALTSRADDAQLRTNFSDLRVCVELLKLLTPYTPQQQLFLQKLSIDHLITISATAEHNEIIDLLQVLPAAEQQQYLEKLDVERLQTVLNDSFTLHGVLDSSADSKAKRGLIDLLGIDHVRTVILSTITDYEDDPLREKTQNLAALLRGFKTEEDFNYILKQLGAEFLLEILSNTENLNYFFQQINTEKQRLVLNMLGAENLKKLLMHRYPENEEATKHYPINQAISDNLTDLFKILNPTHYTVVLNLLGQDWFRKNQLSGPLTNSIYDFDYEQITALLLFIVTADNIKTLVNFAFSYDLDGDRINLTSDQPLLIDVIATAIQPYNTSRELPLVYLLWQSLTSDESKKWIKANHALLNSLLASSLQKWQAETKGFNQKYYLSALAHDGVLAAFVTNGSEFTNIIKNLHQDAQITFLKGLGSEHLKALISNWAMLGRGALAHLNPEAQNCLLELLGQEKLSTIVVNKTAREQVTSYLHLNNQHRLSSMLRRQQLWQYAKIAGVALAITAGVGAFAYVAIPGAAAVITTWTTSILVAVQSLVNAVIAYSLQTAQYAMNLCYALLNTALINIQAHQGLLFIGATLAGIAGLAYLWRDKKPKPAIIAKESRVEQAPFNEHIILEEARKEPRSSYPITARHVYFDRERAFAEQYNGAVLAHKDTKVNPEFAKAAKASLKKRRAAEQAEQAKDNRPMILPVVVPPQQPHPVVDAAEGSRGAPSVGSDNVSVTRASVSRAAPPVIPHLRLRHSAGVQSQHRMRREEGAAAGESMFGRDDASRRVPPPQPRPYAHPEDDLSMCRGGGADGSEVDPRESTLLRSDVRTAPHHAPQPYGSSAPRSRELGLHRLHPVSRDGAPDDESLLGGGYRATTHSSPFATGQHERLYTAGAASVHYLPHERGASSDVTGLDQLLAARVPSAARTAALVGRPPITTAWDSYQQQPHMIPPPPAGAAPLPPTTRVGDGSYYGGDTTSSYPAPLCEPPHGLLSMPPRHDGRWAEGVDDGDRSGPPRTGSGRSGRGGM